MALAPDMVGMFLCHETKDNFNKQRGKDIAAGRAIYDLRPNYPQRLVHPIALDFEITIQDLLEGEYKLFSNRAKRYFKSQSPTGSE